MYHMTKIEDTVRIPPNKFDEPLEEVALQTLNDTYDSHLDKDLGLLICVNEIEEIDGEVNDITGFGAFIRIGPMEALVHVSQVTDDYINYDSKGETLIASESNKTLSKGDMVRSRIVAISLKDKSTKNTKIGLTMRQNGLGRFEWIEQAKNKSKKGKK